MNGFTTSITSTARRYCQCDVDPCNVVVSEGGVVVWAMHSEGMKARNMKWDTVRRSGSDHE